MLGLGEIEAARHQAEQARAVFERESLHVLVISSYCLLASSYARCGRIAEARTMSRDALDRAAILGIPYYRAYAANCLAGLTSVGIRSTGCALRLPLRV
jgi:hypothetical protein